MGDWLAKIIQQWGVVMNAPAPFVTAVLAGLIVIWFALNWSYSSRLDNKDGQIELLTRQRDDYKDKLSGASPDEAKALVAGLRTEINNLKKQIRERNISPETSRAIVAILKPKPPHKIRVMHATGDKTSANYASKIADILRLSGWSVEGPVSEYYFGTVFNLPVLVGKNGDLDGVRVMASAFGENDINIDVTETTNQDGQCDLIVGSRSW